MWQEAAKLKNFTAHKVLPQKTIAAQTVRNRVRLTTKFEFHFEFYTLYFDDVDIFSKYSAET